MSMYNYLLRLFRKKPLGALEEEIDPSMKFLIVGLGNIGNKYAGTRHNIGFEVIDYLAHDKEVKLELNNLGETALIKHKGKQVYLLKPNTYMNLSGKSLRYWMQKLKIPQENVLVIVDDIHLPFSKIRLKTKGKDAGHNGLKDIQEKLGTQSYARLKFGIGNDFKSGQQVKYVLGTWNKKEVEELGFSIPKAAEIALSFVAIGAKYTMDQFN